MKTDEALLARFIARIAASEELVEAIEDVPVELWDLSAPEAGGDWVRWKPVAHATAEAEVVTLEARLPAPLPPLYRLFISRYRYLRIDLGSCSLLANPPAPGLQGLTDEMFRDKILSTVALRNGYIQFGRPTNLDYDPVCFNTQRRLSNRDFEIVQLDHEQILCYDRIRVRSVLAPSFRSLVEQFVRR